MLGYTEGVPLINNDKPAMIKYHKEIFVSHEMPKDEYNNQFDRINLLSLESEQELEEIDWSELV
ncbi:8833_t:CDS:2 [Cetraspora pellucida]|uniref:8833_t:CDS:1 n=1 Tax=Cetraspora pellucida TaxID=1433469 RepID=A0ACA9LLZ0_9GLOM|nr:8833_t:CDS:2 [Cetraspora pellucida]